MQGSRNPLRRGRPLTLVESLHCRTRLIWGKGATGPQSCWAKHVVKKTRHGKVNPDGDITATVGLCWLMEHYVLSIALQSHPSPNMMGMMGGPLLVQFT